MEEAYDSLIGLGSEFLVNLGIFADGYMIVDTGGVVRRCKIIRSFPGLFEENAVIGKNVLEIYPELTKETSYIYLALKGIPTINQFTERHLASGNVVTYLENDYPIKQDGTIIGAICIVKYSNLLIREVDLSGTGGGAGSGTGSSSGPGGTGSSSGPGGPGSSDISGGPSDSGDCSGSSGSTGRTGHSDITGYGCSGSPGRPSSMGKISNSSCADLYGLSDIIGESKPVRQLKERILQTAKTNSSVLLFGQTGTGKEMAAQSIYSESSRSRGPFLSQNCAAIPSNLLESLFFGTTKGSYTGALDKEGIFEQAKGGVIFLDEINSMDMAVQAKLLKVIEEKCVTRIGSAKSVKIDVRIIAAVNEPPLLCIQEGRLRSDLFYRLSAVQIELPSLAERRDDIPLLTQYFVDRYRSEINPRISGVSPRVASLFQDYSWPGNVRELKNALEGAFNFASGPLIEAEDLPGYLKNKLTQEAYSSWGNALNADGAVSPGLGSMLQPPGGSIPVIPLKDAVEQFEKNYILLRIPYAQSLTDLANQLGMTRQSLNYKLKKYGIRL